MSPVLLIAGLDTGLLCAGEGGRWEGGREQTEVMWLLAQ